MTEDREDDFGPSPGFVEEMRRAIEAPEPSATAPEPDPVLQGWDALRAKRRGAADERDAVRQRWLQGLEQAEPPPTVGVSPLAKQLEEEGWFHALQTEHAAQREREHQMETERAIRDSQEAARQAARHGQGSEFEFSPEHTAATQRMLEGIIETPRWLAQQLRQMPGGAMSGIGS